MKPLILLIVLTGFLFSNAFAQESNREVYPKQASINHNNAVKSFSSDFVTTLPAGSSLADFQHLANRINNLATIHIEGSENVTMLSQHGYGLTGLMRVEGDHNQTSLSQTGTDLLSVLNLRGDFNQFDMQQYGSNLQNYFHISGSGLSFDARQTNAGMELIQTGGGSIPLSIKQTGRPSPIIINKN